ncbi:caspase, EACC1-associated type [Streptomyces sp. NPDC001492]
MSGLPDPRSTRVLLIGSDTFEHLENLPAAGANLEALHELFTGSVWNLSPEHCTVLSNPASPYAVDRSVEKLLQEADTALLYYVGHGVLDEENGSLCLALPQSAPGFHHATAVPYQWIRRRVARAPRASRVVVVLDCCFSGRAMQAGDTASSTVAALADGDGIEGVYLMAAASENAAAVAPPGAHHTAFTGAWIDVITKGVVHGPKYLTLDMIFEELKDSLTRRDLPAPVSLDRNQLGRLSFCLNPVHEPVRADLSVLQKDRENSPVRSEIDRLTRQLGLLRRARRWEEYRQLVDELAADRVDARKQAVLLRTLEEIDPDIADDLATTIGEMKHYKLVPDVVLALDREGAVASWSTVLQAAGHACYPESREWLTNHLPVDMYAGAVSHLYRGMARKRSGWVGTLIFLLTRDPLTARFSFMEYTAAQQSVDDLVRTVVILHNASHKEAPHVSDLLEPIATTRTAEDVVAVMDALRRRGEPSLRYSNKLLRLAATLRGAREAQKLLAVLRAAGRDWEADQALRWMAVDNPTELDTVLGRRREMPTVAKRIIAFRETGGDADAEAIMSILARKGSPDVFVQTLQQLDDAGRQQDRKALLGSVRAGIRRARLASAMRHAGFTEFRVSAFIATAARVALRGFIGVVAALFVFTLLATQWLDDATKVDDLRSGTRPTRCLSSDCGWSWGHSYSLADGSTVHSTFALPGGPRNFTTTLKVRLPDHCSAHASAVSYVFVAGESRVSGQVTANDDKGIAFSTHGAHDLVVELAAPGTPSGCAPWVGLTNPTLHRFSWQFFQDRS